MTYLLPDDWYANHGLAPGDARKPKAILQPRPGNLAPTPPMRGYYGRVPIPMLTTKAVAFRPFMDTDVMWGVNGLGAQGDINSILAQLKKDIRNEALKQAALSVSIAIGLNAVPVLGTATAAIYSAIQGVVGTQNQAKVKEIMADTNTQANRIVSEYELKTEAAQNAVFDQEMDAGTTIAMACQGMSGLGSWGSDVWSKVKQQAVPKTLIKHVVMGAVVPYPVLIAAQAAKNSNSSVLKKLASPVTRADAAVESTLDTLSGAKAVDDASKARTRILTKVRTDMDAQYQQAVANMNSPEFRAALRKSIATKVVTDPDVASVIRTRCSLAPGQPLPGESVIASMPSGVKGGVWAAAGVTAAIVAFVAVGGGHQ